MNPFLGITNLWRLSGEYDAIDVLYWYYKRLLSGQGSQKIDQNSKIYDFRVHFVNLNFKK